MAATIEINYFNSFWIKKMDSIAEVRPNTGVIDVDANSATQTITTYVPDLGYGQRVYAKDANGVDVVGFPSKVYLISSSMAASPYTVVLSEAVNLTATDVLIFGPIELFTEIPRVYSSDPTDWYAEEARIRGDYNNTNVDLGVKAYLVEDNASQNNRFNSMIYSGVFNSRTGVNNTNQFSVAENITRSIDPSYGSIQKLYAEDTNLIIFQELKVSKALIDKDAIYTQEGQPLQAASNVVIGGIVPYAGEYGISTNPESFGVFGYRKYFADRTKNLILRLSQDGITEISMYGMIDFFRDNLAGAGSLPIVGGYDMHNKQYIVSIGGAEGNVQNGFDPETVSFDEAVKGWTSRFDYFPDAIGSLRNNLYTYFEGEIWQHYSTSVNRAQFYNTTHTSSVNLVLNPSPSVVKNFNTINYEGSSGWIMESLTTDQDVALQISEYQLPTTLADLQTSLFTNNFKRKENKYFANLLNLTAVQQGEVLFGQAVTGVKGFTSEVKFTVPTTNQSTQRELFAVSSEFNRSSY